MTMRVLLTRSRTYPTADDDGFISFEEFIISYARPKPILKNILIMAINTAVIFFILQAPMLDVMMKVRTDLAGRGMLQQSDTAWGAGLRRTKPRTAYQPLLG
jgi:hypothetical protein